MKEKTLYSIKNDVREKTLYSIKNDVRVETKKTLLKKSLIKIVPMPDLSFLL